MKRFGFAMLAVLLGCSVSALAIDRDAKMIDTLSLNLADLDETDQIGGSLWGETAVHVERQDWAVLFGGGFDNISPDDAHNVYAWTLGVGLKYYILPVTSVSAVGTYTRYDFETEQNDNDAKAATATLKQRLLPADAPLCPFVKGALTWRDRTTFSQADPEEEDNTYSEVLLQIGGGAEFEMREDFTFVFDLGYVIAEESDDKLEDLDGFVASIAMQYYWPYDDAF